MSEKPRKKQGKRPDIVLVDIAILVANGSTMKEVGERLGITQQAVSDRVSRDKELFDRITVRYLEEIAAARAYLQECAAANIPPDNNKRI